MGTGRLPQSLLVYMWTFVPMYHPVGIPDRIVIYFPNRIVSWNNPQHLVKFQDRMVILKSCTLHEVGTANGLTYFVAFSDLTPT